MMADEDKVRKETLRQIKIKTGVVKRLHKEFFHYEKEAQKETEKLEKMTSDGKDEHDLRKQQEVIDESRMMIPDTKRKFIAAHNDLQTLLGNSGDYHDAEEFTQATELLTTTKELKG